MGSYRVRYGKLNRFAEDGTLSKLGPGTVVELEEDDAARLGSQVEPADGADTKPVDADAERRINTATLPKAPATGEPTPVEGNLSRLVSPTAPAVAKMEAAAAPEWKGAIVPPDEDMPKVIASPKVKGTGSVGTGEGGKPVAVVPTAKAPTR